MNVRGSFCALCMIFLVGVLPLPGQDRDDQYLHVFDLIEQADSLSASRKPGPALEKYREAQAALQVFQRTYPDWNPKMVTFRLNYLNEKIAALSQPQIQSAPGSTATATTPNASSSSSKAASSAVPQVKLVEAGAEPRKAVRLHPKAGDKQTSDLTMKIGMDTKAAGQSTPMKMPSVKMTLDFTIKDVSPNGDINYELVVSDATVNEEPGGAPQLAEAMKTAVANFKGMSGTGTLSSRGFVKTSEMKLPANADTTARQAADQMKQSIANLIIPFPEEPVGIGAKWEVKTQNKSEGMLVSQTANYELVSAEGERLSTKIAFVQTAANQKIQNPALPGVKMDLTKMTGNGAATATVDLAKLLPSEAKMDVHSDMSMAMNVGNQKQTIEMSVDVNAGLQTK